MRASKPGAIVQFAGAIFLVIAYIVYASGESGIEISYGYSGVDSQTYDTTNWGGVIAFAVLGLAIMGVGEWMRRSGVGWPANLAARLGLTGQGGQGGQGGRFAAAAPGNSAVHTTLAVSSHLPAQSLHQALVDALAPAVEPPADPGLYVLGDQPGLIELGYGTAGHAPAFTARVAVNAAATGSTARLGFPTSTPAGANPIYDGYVFGAEMDGLLAQVEGFLGQRQLASTTRAPAPA